MMKKIRVILLTMGPLHLIKSAEYLYKYVDIFIIQGWIPGKFSMYLFPLISKIMKKDVSKSFQKRIPKSIPRSQVFGIGIPEFYFWFFTKFPFLFPFNKLSVPWQAHNIFGYLSRKYIRNADILHIRSGSGGGGIIEYAQKKGMKIVVDHSIAHPKFMDEVLKPEFIRNNLFFNFGMESPFWRSIIFECENADLVLVNSDFVKQTFIQMNFDSSKIKVVYLGVRDDFFGLKKEYTLSETPKLLFTGSFGFRKGAEYLIRALNILEEKGLAFEALIVGGYSQKEVNVLLERTPLKNIKFIGHVPQNQLKGFLEKCDLYFFPSLLEGCASSGMEAMASGMPVIATEESGLPINHLYDGYIIPSKDDKMLADAIEELLNNDELREKIGRNAFKKISSTYTWERYAENVSNIYSELLKE